MWALLALVLIAHVIAMFSGALTLEAVMQPLLMPALILCLLTAVPLETTTAKLVLASLVASWFGDLFPNFTTQPRAVSVGFVLISMILYIVALAPLWKQSWDGLKLLMAVPYLGVVFGLFIACADGAGTLLPLVLVYALAIAALAFLGSGINANTWMGGTLLLVTSSVQGVDWFLPGASIAHADVWVMATYVIGHAFLLLGVLQILPNRRWSGTECGGSIIEG
jgi:hypothetical protein